MADLTPGVDPQVVSDVTAVARSLGVDPNLALAIMMQESGGDPTAIGDNGHSVGLFQLNDQGEGAGMSVSAREDPVTNATIALRQVAAVQQQHPDWTPGQIAAAAQRPADQSTYAQSIDSMLSGQGGTLPNGYDQAGGNTVTATDVGSQGPALSMNDIPAVDAYIRANYGTDAWLLDIPDVKAVLEQAVVEGDDAAQVQAKIEQTAWWKTTSQAQKNYEQAKANNPADYSFTTPGSTASQTLAQIMSTAAQAGVTLDQATAQQLASNAMEYGWSSQQIQQAIGSRVTYGGAGQTNAGGVAQQLQQIAGQYLQNVSPDVLRSWMSNIAAGTQTAQQFQAYMAQNAEQKWTGMANLIKQGMTPSQIVDPLRQDAAKTMEIAPGQIDFVNDPTYSKILDYVPPGETDHRVMTQSEMDQYLKGLPQWGKTQQARDAAAQMEQTLLQTWGKVGPTG